MSKLVLTNAYVKVDGNDISDHVKKVELTYESEEVDVTSMGPDGTRERVGGLKNWSASIDVFQDYAGGSVDEILFPLVGAVVECIFKPVNGATSSTNPAYTGNGLVVSFPPISGEVGAASMASVRIASSGILVRDVTP